MIFLARIASGCRSHEPELFLREELSKSNPGIIFRWPPLELSGALASVNVAVGRRRKPVAKSHGLRSKALLLTCSPFSHRSRASSVEPGDLERETLLSSCENGTCRRTLKLALAAVRVGHDERRLARNPERHRV